MKAKVTLLAVFLTIFLAFGTAHSAIDGSGLGILLIDGDDSDNTVSPSLFNIGHDYDLYYRADQGSWTQINDIGIFGTFAGGSVIDFGINVSGNFDSGVDNRYSYKSSDANITYDNAILASYSRNPVVDDAYYRNVYINWIGLTDNFKIEILGAQNTDGFAPVPIPGALLLLGTGLIGFIGLRRKLGAKS